MIPAHTGSRPLCGFLLLVSASGGRGAGLVLGIRSSFGALMGRSAASWLRASSRVPYRS